MILSEDHSTDLRGEAMSDHLLKESPPISTLSGDLIQVRDTLLRIFVSSLGGEA